MNKYNMNTDYYKFKFGRDKRQRSIKEIHDLYIRSKERSNTKRTVIMDIINEIVENIPLTEKYGSQKHITYFQEDDTLYQYEIAYDRDWESYGVSTNRVKFEGTTEEIRKQTLDFIISLDLAFELGEKYRKHQNFNNNLHHRVMHYLNEAITKNLKEIYKDVKFLEMPKVIPVNIGNHQYIFHPNQSSSKYYKTFDLIGEMEIDTIEMQ